MVDAVPPVPRKIRSDELVPPRKSLIKEQIDVAKGKTPSAMTTKGGGGEVAEKTREGGRGGGGKALAIELPTREKTLEKTNVSGEQPNRPGDKNKKTKKKKKMISLNLGDVISTSLSENTWTVVKKLGSGGFGEVYKVTSPKFNEGLPCALKTEPSDDDVKDKGKLRLKVEVTVLMAAMKAELALRRHFTELIDRGKDKTTGFKFIVMSMLGPSLEDVKRKLFPGKDNLSKMTVHYVGQQTLEAISHLYQIGFLHRDIKPPNFAIGADRADRLIYIFDFGICRRIFEASGAGGAGGAGGAAGGGGGGGGGGKELRKARSDNRVRFIGTTRYASIRCHMRCEQGRKDDCESWLYMMYDLFDCEEGLPWKKITVNGRSALKAVLNLKESFMGVSSDQLVDFAPDVPEPFPR